MLASLAFLSYVLCLIHERSDPWLSSQLFLSTNPNSCCHSPEAMSILAHRSSGMVHKLRHCSGQPHEGQPHEGQPHEGQPHERAGHTRVPATRECRPHERAGHTRGPATREGRPHERAGHTRGPATREGRPHERAGHTRGPATSGDKCQQPFRCHLSKIALPSSVPPDSS